jgi:MSHA type pilus biogenesis protein MshL
MGGKMKTKKSKLCLKLKFLWITYLIFFISSPECFSQEAFGPPQSFPSQSQVTKPQEANKISLDIKGMDVIDVLKMLATRAGMNLVIGKNVTGRVTIFLKDVNVWDAFEIILLANDLAYEKKGEIITIMTQRDYELLYGERFQDKKQAKILQLKYAKAADLSRALSQIKTNIGRIVVDEGSNSLALIDAPETIKEMEDFIAKTDLPLETKVFSLNYAPADKLSAKLQEAVTKSVGSLKIDERTNKIAITDYPEKIQQISQLITAFDEKTPQVLIDAQIIEISPKDEFSMGVDWDYWLNKNVRYITSLPAPGLTSASTIPTKIALGIAAANPSSGTVSAEKQYKTILDMLRVIGATKILSSPRIMALNNQEAKILIGTKEVYVSQTTSQSGSGTQVTADQVNFVDVGIKLYVTPTINRDNFITMKIRPEISSTTKSYEYTSGNNKIKIPIVDTSEAETTVTIKDGVTIIMGGLKKDKRVDEVKKIPFFGDIPWIGFFFRSMKDERTKQELVILLTPRIMSGENPITDIHQSVAKEGVLAKMEGGEIVTEKISVSGMYGSLGAGDSSSGTSYFELVSEKILSLAKLNNPSGEKGEVSLNFIILSNGLLKEEPKVISTTNPYLIPYATQAIKAASPFPSFGGRLNKSEEVFRISLVYE